MLTFDLCGYKMIMIFLSLKLNTADLAFVIAERYPHLVYEKDDSGMIGLQLLSSNPAAFKSGNSHGLLKRFIYYCMVISLLNIQIHFAVFN